MISAVVVFHSDLPRLRATVESLGPQVDELTVVDVGPGSEVAGWAHPDVGVIDGGANRGYGWACNLGIAAARGDTVLISNPDVVYEAGSVAAMAGVAARGALVAPRQTSCRASGRVEHAADTLQLGISRRASLNRWLSIGRRRFDARRSALLDRTAGVLSVPVDMTLSGASLMAGRSTWDRVGGFDERFFLYQEDADLSLRARAAGVPLAVANGALVRHETGSSRAGLDPRSLSWAIVSERTAWRSRRLPVALLVAVQVCGLSVRALRELASGDLRRAGIWWGCTRGALRPGTAADGGDG